MLARISTRLACTEGKLWQRIVNPGSLQYVASPILTFVPAEEEGFDDEWQVGRVYHLNLYFLRIIPLGQHTIQLVNIDRDANTILSKESGQLARVWNHRIHFREVSPGIVSYTDEIEIKSGWLTPVIWLFAQLFYRHRQRRWKSLLQNSMPDQCDANKAVNRSTHSRGN